MNLIIDIGNTSTKYHVFEHDREILFDRSDLPDSTKVDGFLKRYPSADKCIVSASGHLNQEFISNLKPLVNKVVVMDNKTPMPFKSHYDTPETIGLDRLAAVAGATVLYPENAVLIIDAGTAITYDVKNVHNEHMGGNISPGLEMRFKALNTFTKNLPLLNASKENTLLGNSTQQAIINGVVNGIIFEIEGIIDAMENIYTNLTVLLTGGDAQFFDNRLKKTIFVLPKLVSTGLNTILNYNVANT